jgi:hypothetical protein
MIALVKEEKPESRLNPTAPKKMLEETDRCVMKLPVFIQENQTNKSGKSKEEVSYEKDWGSFGGCTAGACARPGPGRDCKG